MTKKQKQSERVLTTIRADREDWNRIRKAAIDEGLGTAEFVVKVCLAYLDKKERK